MIRPTLLDRVAQRNVDLAEMEHEVARDPGRAELVLDGLQDERARVRFGCAKLLESISENHPEILYPHFEAFEQLAGGDNQILSWVATRILGNLASADGKGRIEGMIGGYLSRIDGPAMIAAACTIQGAVRIALAKPALRPRIVKAILRVERARYKTAECRNVAIGHALTGLGVLFRGQELDAAVARFAERQTHNSRNATRKKASALLRHARQPAGRRA